MSKRVKGARRVKSLLKRIEPAMRDEMIVVLTGAGRELATTMRGAAPVLKKARKGRVAGALAAAFNFKVYPKTLRLRVGLIGKALNNALFYAGILEHGRGIKKTIDKRGHKIGVIAPLNIVYGARTNLRAAVGPPLKGIWGRALDKAAAGAEGGDD